MGCHRGQQQNRPTSEVAVHVHTWLFMFTIEWSAAQLNCCKKAFYSCRADVTSWGGSGSLYATLKRTPSWCRRQMAGRLRMMTLTHLTALLEAGFAPRCVPLIKRLLRGSSRACASVIHIHCEGHHVQVKSTRERFNHCHRCSQASTRPAARMWCCCSRG